ncbi:hypothetical protein ADICYQ_0637 [Cyclobacterium qasimii M12-11B]|uniref:Uncharacterized protein n=1 Tax=Cyclobacterium qasimii M12-11B TaxID=641524 RepID=S7VM67_9BACT|nr:hypothetical protein ADICYQ_0637 [Cyclobacterium qasimii M12-11B]
MQKKKQQYRQNRFILIVVTKASQPWLQNITPLGFLGFLEFYNNIISSIAVRHHLFRAQNIKAKFKPTGFMVGIYVNSQLNMYL